MEKKRKPHPPLEKIIDSTQKVDDLSGGDGDKSYLNRLAKKFKSSSPNNDDESNNEYSTTSSLFDQLPEECFELVLRFLCMSTLSFEDTTIGCSDSDELRLEESERKIALRNLIVVVDWKELKTISQVSKRLFSKCLPIIIEYEAKKVMNQVFDNTSDFFRPFETQLEILRLRNESNRLKLEKVQQWELWFRGEISNLNGQVTSVDAQNELKEKILNRASYSFKDINRQQNGRWEVCAYCHLLDDLHLYHFFESNYEECNFTISVFTDLDQVNKSINKKVMKYLVLPDTTFFSEMSDEDIYDEEENSVDYNSLGLITSEYVNSSVKSSVLNHVREKLKISSNVTDLELVAALVYILPYDITVNSPEIHYGTVEFDKEEIDFTIKYSKKKKERTYERITEKDLCCIHCKDRSIFDVGHDILLKILEFLRLRYVTTLSETNKTFYNIFLRSGWSFPIRMGKIIDSFSPPILFKECIEKSLSVVRDARYYAFSSHPPFVKYLSVRFANIDYLSSFHTIMKVGNHTFSFNSFEDEGSSSYFTINDITLGGEERKLYDSDHDFFCNQGRLRVKTEAVLTLEGLFGTKYDRKDLVDKFLNLLPISRDVNWLFLIDIRIGDEE